jgi:hypothetical protein
MMSPPTEEGHPKEDFQENRIQIPHLLPREIQGIVLEIDNHNFL